MRTRLLDGDTFPLGHNGTLLFSVDRRSPCRTGPGFAIRVRLRRAQEMKTAPRGAVFRYERDSSESSRADAVRAARRGGPREAARRRECASCGPGRTAAAW